MSKVRICLEIPDEDFRAYEREAERRGVTVEALLERMVSGLLQEMETEQREGTDHPIFPA